MATVQSPPEQRVILSNVSWETYEHLLADHLDASVPRFAYDQGVLEIVSPSGKHERINRSLALLVEIAAEEREVDLVGLGSTTFKRKDLLRGFEPDSCFYIAHEAAIASKEQIDLLVDPPPDLVIEIDYSAPSLDKLPLYAAIGVPEVWRYSERTEHVTILRRDGDEYRSVHASVEVPPLTAEALTRFVIAEMALKRTAWVREVRAWIRARIGEDHHERQETR